MVKVLFVCMGNICRSPTAQGVFLRLLQQQGLGDRIEVDSDVARFSMTIEGIPSANPRTGRIVPLSTVAALRALVSELKVGT